MDRIQLTLVISAGLFGAFLIGWITRWLYGGLKHSKNENMQEMNNLAHQLSIIEEDRDRLLSDFQLQLGDANGRIIQLEAELQAAMEGLGDARREAEELRSQTHG